MGAEKAWCGRVDCATGPGDVCQCKEPCPVGDRYIIVLEALLHEFCSGVP